MPRLFYQAILRLALLATPLPCLIVPASAQEAASQTAMHTQSAFLFADRKDWNEAQLHAKQSGNPVLMKFIDWLYYQDAESGASFEEIAAFLRANPDWPQQNRLKLRAEQSIRLSGTSDADLKKWFAENPPASGIAKIAFAELSLRQHADPASVAQLIRDGWRDGDFDEASEKRILSSYRSLLRTDDHIARTDRLLWQEKITPAQRMLELLPGDQRTLANARIALIQDKKTAPFMVMQVSKALHANPGLIYNRMMWRDHRDDDSGVREMLLAAPKEVPFPEKWWKVRERQIRKAIDERNYALARSLLNNHGQTGGSEYADALWLKGWLLTEFLNQPQEGYQQFYTMFDAVKYPVSKARAAYWAARAAAKSGDTEAANSWYTSATAYPSTFYGQVAYATLRGTAPLNIPSDPIAPKEVRQQFHDRDIVKAIRLCIDNQHDDMATQLVNHLIDKADSPHELALAALMVRDQQSTMLGVRAAKRALQKNTLLMETGFPVPPLKAELATEPALAYAIARQESEFDPRARSRSNALGYMQLLPGTAKETAKKNDIAYAESRLFEPSYNATLGSLYLQRLVNAYDGSYVKAIAAYNAGPGRVRDWVAEFGQPGNTPESVINWIEKIPFTETRNYVQRVLENLQIYRYLLSQDEAPSLHIHEDLLR